MCDCKKLFKKLGTNAIAPETIEIGKTKEGHCYQYSRGVSPCGIVRYNVDVFSCRDEWEEYGSGLFADEEDALNHIKKLKE